MFYTTGVTARAQASPRPRMNAANDSSFKRSTQNGATMEKEMAQPAPAEEVKQAEPEPARAEPTAAAKPEPAATEATPAETTPAAEATPKTSSYIMLEEYLDEFWPKYDVDNSGALDIDKLKLVFGDLRDRLKSKDVYD